MKGKSRSLSRALLWRVQVGQEISGGHCCYTGGERKVTARMRTKEPPSENERGDVGSGGDHPLRTTNRARSTICWR